MSMFIFGDIEEGKFEPLTNKGLFKCLPRDVQFDEPIIAFDNINDQLYITTETKMYRLQQNGTDFKPIRTW